MKLNDTMVTSLTLNKDILRPLDDELFSDEYTTIQKTINNILQLDEKKKSPNSVFLSKYADVCFCIIQLLQSEKGNLLTFHRAPSELGENYHYLRIRETNPNNEPDIILKKDFYRTLYSKSNESQMFMKKIYSLVNPLSIYIGEEYKDKNGDTNLIISNSIPLWTKRIVSINMSKRNLQKGNKYKKGENIPDKDKITQDEEIQIYFSKNLFEFFEKDHTLYLPDKINTLIDTVLNKYDIKCFNKNDKILRPSKKQILDFILFLQKHTNNKDYVWNEENEKILDFARAVNPSELLKDNGYIRSKNDYLLYVLMYTYALNCLYITQNGCIDYVLGVPDITLEPFSIRIKKYLSNKNKSTLETVKQDKRVIQKGEQTYIFNDTVKESKGFTPIELNKMALEFNEKILYIFTQFSKRKYIFLLKDPEALTPFLFEEEQLKELKEYYRCKQSFWEYIIQEKKISLLDIKDYFNNLSETNKLLLIKDYVLYNNDIKLCFEKVKPNNKEKITVDSLIDNAVVYQFVKNIPAKNES